MVDRIQKTLRKLRERERRALEQLLDQIKQGDLSGLDLKKLRGLDDVYRARKGDLRVIFRRVGSACTIIAIERRSDTTY